MVPCKENFPVSNCGAVNCQERKGAWNQHGGCAHGKVPRKQVQLSIKQMAWSKDNMIWACLLRAIQLAISYLGSQRLGDSPAACWMPRNHSCYIHCALPCLARPWRCSLILVRLSPWGQGWQKSEKRQFGHCKLVPELNMEQQSSIKKHIIMIKRISKKYIQHIKLYGD